ncbi:MAG: hypothetical protein ACKOPN_06810, partial [Prochlorococcaceae cyanobacterium]
MALERASDGAGQPVLQLLASSSSEGSWRGSSLARSARAPLTLVVGVPYLSFDPTAPGSVDAVNNTLHMAGLGAFNGQEVTYYPDASYSRTATVNALAAARADQVLAGSTRWDGVVLPDALADGELVEATVVTAIPLPGSTTAPADLAGLAHGSVVHLRQRFDGQGQPLGVELFHDAQGTTPLLLATVPTADSSRVAHFQVRLNQAEGSGPIPGLMAGEQLQLHALGHDLYQVATDPQQFIDSQPYAPRGQQILEGTRLVAAQGTSDTVSLPGISLTTLLKGKDSAKASGGVGSAPKPWHFLDNPWMAQVVQGVFISSSFVPFDEGKAFKEAIRQGGGADNPNTRATMAGALAINTVDHLARVSLGDTSRLSSGGAVEIGTTSDTLLRTVAKATTSLDTQRQGVFTLAGAWNTVVKRAETELAGLIQPLPAQPQRAPSLTVTNAATLPVATFDSFGSVDKLAAIKHGLTRVPGAIGGVLGALTARDFSSLASVVNKNKPTAPAQPASPETGQPTPARGAALIGAIGINTTTFDTKASTLIRGNVQAGAMAVTNQTGNNLVLGAGMLKMQLGLGSILSGFVGGSLGPWATDRLAAAATFAAATAESLKEGTSGKNSLGATLQLLEINSRATTTIESPAVLHLSGELSLINQQGRSLDGQETDQIATLAVASGVSENLGLSGSVSLTYGEGFSTGTTVQAGAQVRAAGMAVSAIDTANSFDLAGAVQRTGAVGVGTTAVIRRLGRDTTNRLEALPSLAPASGDGVLDLNTRQDGSVLVVSVAGSYAAPNTSLSRDLSSSLSLWGGDRITSLGLAGAGSVNLLQLSDITANRVGTAESYLSLNQDTTAPYRIQASARQATRLQNWSGAAAFGKDGPTQPSGQAATELERQASAGLGAIAGAAAVNQLGREVTNAFSGINAGDRPLVLQVT